MKNVFASNLIFWKVIRPGCHLIDLKANADVKVAEFNPTLYVQKRIMCHFHEG